MKEVVIFNGSSCLDFSDLRLNALRIPEVMARVRRTQQVWDYAEMPNLEWANFLSSEDSVFLNSIRYKSLAAGVIQLGLFDRYVRQHRCPDYFLGDLKEDSPVKVAAGLESFEDFLLHSRAFRGVSHLELAPQAGVPILAGISLAELGVLIRCEDTEGVEEGGPPYRILKTEGSDVQSLLSELIEGQGVQRFVNIGPGTQLVHKGQEVLAVTDVQVLESIDIDPLLSWFWPEMRAHHPG